MKKTHIALLTLAGILVVGLFIGWITLGADTEEAEGYAQAKVAKLYPGQKVISLQCQNKDSDGDGYVSCDVSLEAKDPTKENVVKSLECAATWPWQFNWAHTGCRAPKIAR